MKATATALLAWVLVLIGACAPTANHNQAVYVLIDTSGTYVKELDKARAVVNYLLGTINPGDSMAAGREIGRAHV